MKEALRERLLQLMDRKNHWAWSSFAKGEIPLPRLRVHFQQEWSTYVRDFPVLLARVLGHGPPDEVRRALAANLYEEQTGGISRAAPHPELFLQMMVGCGYSRDDFARDAFIPEAAAYRAFLDDVTYRAPWIVGCAVLTIFVEGSVNERREIAATPSDAPDEASIERAIAEHPLVRVHGVPTSAMELVRVHKRVEGGHRLDAWQSVLGHVRADQEGDVVAAIERALSLWLLYRDGVARECGLTR
jgi:pyrroloquinoline-quinone synthase